MPALSGGGLSKEEEGEEEEEPSAFPHAWRLPAPNREGKIHHKLKQAHLFIQVLFLVTSSHGLYSGADHYWPLNEIGYSHVYDHRQPKEEKWHGIVKGNKRFVQKSVQLALAISMFPHKHTLSAMQTKV